METKPDIPRQIIADSSALISLVVTTNVNNTKARSIVTTVSKAEHTIVIPSEVFAETINLLGKNLPMLKQLKQHHCLSTQTYLSLLQQLP